MFYWNKKIFFYKKLLSLGFFKTKLNIKSNNKFKNLVSFKSNSSFFFLLSFAVNKFKKLVFLLMPIINKNPIFLFIDFNKFNMFSLSNYWNLIFSCYKNYIIYDWAYGVLSNFFEIELEEYTFTSSKLPNIVFLLNLIDQERMVCTELRNRNLLSIGLANVQNKHYIDYPFFIKHLEEPRFFFFKLILYVLSVNKNENN